MKTTSYNISKKLAEIGFEADTDFCWYQFNNVDGSPNICLCYIGEDCDIDAQHYFRSLGDERATACYGLETILEALPKERNLLTDFNHYLRMVFENGKKREKVFMGYWMNQVDEEGYHGDFLVEQEEDESLADTAARLLILLYEKGYEKGIVKFNKIKKMEL